MKLDDLRREIDFRRNLIARQRKDILSLQRSGISTTSAESLLQRMLDKVDELCTERDRLRDSEPKQAKVLGGRKW